MAKGAGLKILCIIASWVQIPLPPPIHIGDNMGKIKDKMIKAEEELIEEFAKILDWYGGVVDFEANMGTFWWTNRYGQTYTMIVHEVNE